MTLSHHLDSAVWHGSRYYGCAALVRCAVKVPKTVEMWAEELRVANAAMNGGTDTKVSKKSV